MKIVVLAHENDNHTAPLKWALETAGYKVACWGGTGWKPELQSSMQFNGEAKVTLGPHSVDPGDVVWIRRPNPPLHNPNTNEADKKFAEGEYRWFNWNTLYLLEMLPVRVVNPYSASRLINNKSVQLLLAKQCGMNVPETLMSNSPQTVRSFLERRGGRNICKTFFPHVWQRATGTIAVTETFELNAHQLPRDEVMTYAPAIYQEMVEKEFDVRMVLLGNTVYSYSLHNPNRALDWRQDCGQGLVEVRIIETPPEVERAVLEFARRSGICFGSLDFAIGNDGRWWFLEINEEGQFLWLDEFNPEVNMQQKFLSFLTLPAGATRAEIEARQNLFPSWKDYSASPEKEQYVPEESAGAQFITVEPS